MQFLCFIFWSPSYRWSGWAGIKQSSILHASLPRYHPATKTKTGSPTSWRKLTWKLPPALIYLTASWMVLLGNVQDSLKFGKHKHYNTDGFLMQGSRVKVAQKHLYKQTSDLVTKITPESLLLLKTPLFYMWSNLIQSVVAVKGSCSHVCWVSYPDNLINDKTTQSDQNITKYNRAKTHPNDNLQIIRSLFKWLEIRG